MKNGLTPLFFACFFKSFSWRVKELACCGVGGCPRDQGTPGRVCSGASCIRMAAEETIQKMQSGKEFLEDEVGIKPEPILPFAKTLSAFAFMDSAFQRTACWVNKIPLLNRLWKLRRSLTAHMAEFGDCY